MIRVLSAALLASALFTSQSDGTATAASTLPSTYIVLYKQMVVPTDAAASLSRAVFFGPKPFFNQQLNSSRWPSYCDHSVTSAMFA